MTNANDESLIPVFIPALVALLANAEREKGSPLVMEEVNEIRDNGVCMMMRQSIANRQAEERGYHDINPHNAWEEWQAIRKEVFSSESDV